MQHKWSLVVLCPAVLALSLTPACSSHGGGGGDDDDITIDTGGAGEGEGEGEGEGAGTCAAACTTIADICTDSTEAGCLEECNRFQDNSSGACLTAFSDLNACVSTASACDPTDGVTGCEAEGSALNTACANGCVDIVTCFNACADGDQACGQACIQNGEPDGASALNTLVSCWTEACGEPPAAEPELTTWQQCLDDSCLDEQSACR